MPTRNVVLTKRQERLIETLVESGRYQNASEVLRDGLRLVEQRQDEEASRLKALRDAARTGLAALERGEFKEFENIKDLRAYLNDLSEKVISRATNAAENEARDAELRAEIRRHRFGLLYLRGRYIENYGLPCAMSTDEHAYLVRGNDDDSGNLKGFLRKYGRKYEQDGVIHMEPSGSRLS